MTPSIEALWETVHTRLKRFILARVEDEATADDILQEVFLRIHTRIDTLRDTDRLESWVYQIARNAIIDHHRARRPIASLSDDALADTLPDEVLSCEACLYPEPDAAEEVAQSLRGLAEELPEPYRQAILLTEFEGLTQKELAERLGISLSGAKSRVQRAREKIKAQLLACCHFEFDHYGRIIGFCKACCCCTPTVKP